MEARGDEYVLELYHKNLKTTPWKRTSDRTKSYNCIAWALGHSDRRWDPFPKGTDYWPRGLDSKNTVAVWVKLFQKFRYRRCANGNYQPGYEKVAIYVADDEPQHVARLIGENLWTSKLGELHDIEHTLGGLDDERYGKPIVFMRRILKRKVR